MLHGVTSWGRSVYDVYTVGGKGVRLRWMHVDGVGVSSMWPSTENIKAH